MAIRYWLLMAAHAFTPPEKAWLTQNGLLKRVSSSVPIQTFCVVSTTDSLPDDVSNGWRATMLGAGVRCQGFNRQCARAFEFTQLFMFEMVDQRCIKLANGVRH